MTLQTSTSEACQIVAGGGSQPRNYAPGSPGPHLLDVWKFHIEAKEILDVISLTSIYSSQYQRRNENPFQACLVIHDDLSLAARDAAIQP